MDNQQYERLLKQVCAHLKALTIERGPEGKGFGAGDVVDDPSIAVEDKEYFFVLGDKVISDSENTITTSPYKTGDRIVWAVKRVADNNGCALAIHYYVFSDDNSPIFTIGYCEDAAAIVAEDIYQFLVNGNTPSIVKKVAN